MAKLNPEYVEAVRRTVNTCPYFSLLGMRIEDLGPGESHVVIDVEPKHLQPFGIVHGGVFSSLMDASCFWAVFTAVEDGTVLTTVEVKLNYLAPSQSGQLIGRGRLIKLGKTLGLGDARIEDEKGRLLCHGTATVMVVPNLHLSGSDDYPAKFIED
ncbi:MAG: PaaI family thioesterase [Proteobacteria bacterium]|nr:PaaI family thioesterase [Pseudomonadota bacterium]MBU1740362.1 PaaI family thioesterase [Pseudomonadota bacterium]